MCYGKEKQYWFIDQEVLYKNLDEEKTHMPKYIISQKTSEAQQKICELCLKYSLNGDLLLRCKGVNVKIRSDLPADCWISPFWSSPRGRCCQKCHCWSPSAWVSFWRGSPASVSAEL